MKQFAVALLLAVCLISVGCGSNGSTPANINGTWNATLIDSNNVTAFTFGTSLVVNADNSLNISNFTFTSNSTCFGSAQTESGSFKLSGNTNGTVNGTFGFVVSSATPAGNAINLTGTVAGNTITGTWTMSGTGCSGSGSFTMTKM